MTLAGVQTVTGAKTFGTIGGPVGKFILAGSTSGSTILDASAVAGAGTVTLPTTGTLATLAGTEILTGKSIAATQITAGTFAVGTYSFAGSTNSDLGIVTTVDVNGGTIDGVTIGGAAAGAGTFTTLTANAASSLTLGTGSSAAGAVIFQNATNANTVTLQSGVTGTTYTLTLPTAVAATTGFVLTSTDAGVLSWAAQTGGVPTTITVADESTDATSFIAFFTAAFGDLAPKTAAGLTFDATTDTLTATAFSGPLTGNVTGDASGSAATVTGAAQTAITSLGTLTSLAVAGNVTVTGTLQSGAAAGTNGQLTLTGSTSGTGVIKV
ncbi:MAG: hypothetical protein Q8P55_01300, partial [bacterium]|nr:hypothetical protein [bacterium]